MKINNLYKFFDYLGIIVFPYLVFDSIWYIFDGVFDFRILTRLLIGIGGLIIDGYLVFIYKE